jgi:hypothetical protein
MNNKSTEPAINLEAVTDLVSAFDLCDHNKSSIMSEGRVSYI